MSVETLELIVMLVFPVSVIIMIRGLINMKFIRKKSDNRDDIMTAMGLIFFGYFSLIFFYYPSCIMYNQFNIPAFLGFLGFYLVGRLLYESC
jgi:hypothetical protein